MNTSLYVCQLNIGTLVLRLAMAVVMGGIIGLERERKGHPAGFRTYMLVALGATVAMILNQYLDYMQTGPWAETVAYTARTDASRLGAQVINGVGFIGAGTILVTQRQEVKGITTAAGLWASACLGLATGAGFIDCAAAGALLVVLCMGTFSGLESHVMSNARNMNIYVELDKYDDIAAITAGIRADGIRIFHVDVNKGGHGEENIGANISMYLPSKEPHQDVLLKISGLRGIKLISEV